MAEDIELNLNNKLFYVGIALSSNTNYDSAIAVLGQDKKIISLDKFYVLEDLALFFKNFMSKENTVFMVSLPSDNAILEGKWRIHAKNYNMVKDFEINKDNWTNRISSRGAEILSKYKNEKFDIFRYDIAQLRFAYEIPQNYVLRSSLDCKIFHTTLKMKFGFRELPDNMLPASNMEALLGAVFAYDVANKKCSTQNAFNFEGLEVIFKKN